MKFTNGTKNKAVGIKPKKNFAVVSVGALGIALLTVGLYVGLSQLFATEDYYILNTDISARTQIVETMLQKVTTAKGSAPKNAFSLARIQSGKIYSQYPLKAGDIITASNTGLTFQVGAGIPDDWVITSFNISADDAAGGTIGRGDYFDFIGIKKDEGAKYLFHNVLVLERRFNVAKNVQDKDGKIIPLGETLQYIVGMPADDAARLQDAITEFDKIKIVMSPMSLRYKERNVSNLANPFIADMDTEAKDLYEGTDSAFTPVLRDEDGRPVNQANCSKGLINPNDLCSQLKDTVKKEKDKADDVGEAEPIRKKKTNKETTATHETETAETTSPTVTSTSEQTTTQQTDKK